MKLRHEGELRVFHEDANKQQLDRIEGLIRQLIQQGEKIMALTQAQFDAVLTAIDENTTASAKAAGAVAAELDEIKKKLEAGGMTPQEEQAVFDRLGALSTSTTQLKTFLEQVGKPTPTQPPPVEPPPPSV